jgi:hypothetical protein
VWRVGKEAEFREKRLDQKAEMKYPEGGRMGVVQC